MAQKFEIWKRVDWVIILIFLFMVLAGWLNIYSAVYSDEHRSIFDMDQRYGKQMLWIVFSLVLALLIMVTDSNFFVAFSFPIYTIFVFLLIVVLFFGATVNGAKAWLVIGDFMLQPSEFTKLGASLAIAKVMSSYDFSFKSLNSKILLAAILLVPVLFIFLQNDTGSALVYLSFLIPLFREGMSGLIMFFLFFFATLFILSLVLSPLLFLIILAVSSFVVFISMRKKWDELKPALVIFISSVVLISLIFFVLSLDFNFYLIMLIASFLSGVILLFLSIYKRIALATVIVSVFIASLLFSFVVDFAFDNILQPHQQDRINNLLGLKSDPQGKGYHVIQSKIAIGSGGLFGKGFLQGTQTKYNFVPEQSTDFIFCTVGEEWGFLGSIVVIAAFIYLIIRIINLAERQKSIFSRVYGYCVASILFFHFVINIGMTIGLTPVIGIPLPFFSYGGSSLWFFTVLLFIFLRLDASRFEQLR
jgi:rod shape determining protein RodA